MMSNTDNVQLNTRVTELIQEAEEREQALSSMVDQSRAVHALDNKVPELKAEVKAKQEKIAQVYHQMQTADHNA